eukprot:6473178-Amphidinium_carterae.2
MALLSTELSPPTLHKKRRHAHMRWQVAVCGSKTSQQVLVTLLVCEVSRAQAQLKSPCLLSSVPA